MCRYLIEGITIEGITIDVMPTDKEVLGFSNRWYQDAIRWAEAVQWGTGDLSRYNIL